MCAVNIMNIPSSFHDYIDDVLVALINAIMGAQMAASILIFIKTIVIMIRNKLRKSKSPVTPMSPTYLKNPFEYELKLTDKN